MVSTIPKVKAGTALQDGKRVEQSGERIELAKRASDLLGYRLLAQDVTGQREIGVISGKLTEVLLKLEIEILDTASVLDYQMKEMLRINHEAASRDIERYATSWFSFVTWGHVELSRYTEPIPEFVLDVAIRVKETLPEVEFHVQSLGTQPDPFLVAKLGHEVYYLAAWEESRFEGRVSR